MITLMSISLSAQSVFLWDRDLGYVVINPEDPWQYVGMEYGIINALQANGINPTVDEVLPANLDIYDIVFVTAGMWCEG
jgi:hypothetical protein